MNDEHAQTVWAAIRQAGCQRMALDPHHFTTLLARAGQALAQDCHDSCVLVFQSDYSGFRRTA